MDKLRSKNIIEVNEKMTQNIMQWYHNELNRMPDPEELPFLEGVINFGTIEGITGNMTYFNLENGNNFSFSVYAEGVHLMDFTFTEEGVFRPAYKGKKAQQFAEKSKALQESMKQSMFRVLAVLCYISLYKDREEHITATHSRVQLAKKPKKGDNRKRKTYINKIRYTIKESYNSLTGKEYDHHMAAWTVRRHQRTYKSGKTIWIESYVKGDKNKLESEERIYKIGNLEEL